MSKCKAFASIYKLQDSRAALCHTNIKLNVCTLHSRALSPRTVASSASLKSMAAPSQVSPSVPREISSAVPSSMDLKSMSHINSSFSMVIQASSKYSHVNLVKMRMLCSEPCAPNESRAHFIIKTRACCVLGSA